MVTHPAHVRMKTTDFIDLLPYAERLESRPRGSVDLVVIHCTELPDLVAARELGERILYTESGTGNSGHFYLEEDGTVHQWVPIDRAAHHVRGYNERSLGIELCNPGRYPDWYDSRNQHMKHPYSAAQVDRLVQLLQELTSILPGLRHISGHQHLDGERIAASDDPAMKIRRKCDPGPLFPWPEVLSATRLQFFEPD